MRSGRWESGVDALLILEKQLQIHFEDSLEQAHVGTLVQTNLVFPDVDNENLAGRKGKERALALKVLVLATLSPIGALDVHDENILGHLGASALSLFVLGHPDALGGLAALGLGHDGELGAEEVVEEGRLAGGLGAEDGDEVVVEAGLGHVRGLQIVVHKGAAQEGRC